MSARFTMSQYQIERIETRLSKLAKAQDNLTRDAKELEAANDTEALRKKKMDIERMMTRISEAEVILGILGYVVEWQGEEYDEPKIWREDGVDE